MPALSDSQKERLASIEQIGLAKWKDRAETKLMISLLPPLVSDTQRDVFEALLQSAFAAGTAAGSAGIISMMLEEIMAQFPNGPPGRR